MKEAGLLIFDLDGTLVDSSTDIAEAANRTLAAMGREEETHEYIKERIGWGVKMLLTQLMDDAGPDVIDEATARFLDFYGRRLSVHTRAYPGVMDALARFRGAGKGMAVVTNKPEALALRLLSDLGMDGFFEVVVGGDTVRNKKPDPEGIMRVLGSLGVEPSGAAFVGDSPVDCESGRAAGVYTVGVTYGFRPVDELRRAGFDVLIGSFSELESVLK